MLKPPMMNLPNILTVSRLFLLPVILALFLLEEDWGPMAMWWALAVYLVAALTDYLDGWLARKLNQVSALGTFLDPISDKIFVASLLMMFAWAGRLDGIWLVPAILILAREFLVSGLREYLGPKNIQLPVTNLAKWKTASQMLANGILIIGPYVPFGLILGHLTLSLACIVTIITGWGYMKAGLDRLGKIT